MFSRRQHGDELPGVHHWDTVRLNPQPRLSLIQTLGGKLLVCIRHKLDLLQCDNLNNYPTIHPSIHVTSVLPLRVQFSKSKLEEKKTKHWENMKTPTKTRFMFMLPSDFVLMELHPQSRGLVEIVCGVHQVQWQRGG